MKVLYVSPYPPAQDGIGTYTRLLGTAVRAAGHEVAVVVAVAVPESPAEVIGALEHIEDAVAEFRPDVVHVQFAVGAFGSRTLALVRRLDRLDVPVVTTLHEVTRDIALLRGPGRVLYRAVAARSVRLIVHTQGALQALTGIGAPAERAVVIPHFSTPPPAPATTPAQLRARFGLADEQFLLAFGFIHVDKGLDDLVRAMAQLVPPPRVVVAGTVRPRSGPFRVFEAWDRLHLANVRRLARRYGLTGRLVFTGFVPEGDIAAWFGAADAVVLPYRKAEQSGVANLAQAFGVPVIASTAGGLAELFAGSPWTVQPGAPDQLATTIRQFLARGEKAPEGFEPARSPEHTGLDSIAAATVAVYETVTRDHTPRSASGAT